MSNGSRIINENVNVSKGIDRVLHHLDNLILLPHIHGQCESLYTFGFQLFQGRIWTFFQTMICDCHATAFIRHAKSYSLANSSLASGN